jgi:hypothetical protein
MARKRHSRKRHTTRRRRSSMGATGSTIGNVASMLAGAVVGKIAVSKFAANLDPKMQAGAQIAAGFVVNKFVKMPFVKGMGTGMMIGGGLQALTSFGVISAISGIGAGVDVDYMNGDDDMAGIGFDDEMNGSSSIETLAGGFNGFSGSDTIETLAGDDDFE